MAKEKSKRLIKQLKNNSFLIGIDLNDGYTQLATWNFKTHQPELLNPTNTQGAYRIPTILLYDENNKKWFMGQEAISHKNKRKTFIFEKFVNGNTKTYYINKEEISNTKLLAIYISKLLEYVFKTNSQKHLEAIMISLGKLSIDNINNIYEAFEMLNIDKERIRIQGHDESFIHFVINYDLSQNNLGLFNLSSSSFDYYQVDINKKSDELLISVEQTNFSNVFVAHMIENSIKKYFKDIYKEVTNKKSLDEDEEYELDLYYHKNKGGIFEKFVKNQPANVIFNITFPPAKAVMTYQQLYEYVEEFDIKFNEIIEKTFEYENVPYIYLSGNGFSSPWIMQALQTLCIERKVFQSQKLFAKGACLALAYEYNLLKLPKVIIKGQGTIINDYGIIVKVNNKEKFVPIIKAGTRWYNAQGQVVVILDEVKEIPIYTKEENGQIDEIGTIRLDQLPQRPNKTTKLSIMFKYISETECKIYIYDLGFGKLFPSTGKKWQKLISV